MRQALLQAGIAADQLSYIETHGTGTALGDPIEVQAIAEAIGNSHASEPVEARFIAPRCFLGSVKANIGHVETAAGAASLIKVLLCLQARGSPSSSILKS